MPPKLIRLAPKLLSCQIIPHIDGVLAAALGCPSHLRSVAVLTCDQDDSLYAALDHATKFAEVEVVYAKSFYAGSSHASGPLSGEVIGVLAASDPDHIKEGLYALRTALEEEIAFYTLADYPGLNFFPHVIRSLGHFLSKQSGVPVGSPLAYLIAPPMESLVALDLVLKSSAVQLVKYFGPPTETNFAGAYLSGDIDAVEAASRIFIEAIIEIAKRPLIAAERPFRLRR